MDMDMAMDSDGAWEIQESREENKQMWNKLAVETLYKSLALRDSEMVAKILAGDLEWWFHGPPGGQHMMRVLTGESDYSRFEFRPRRVSPIWDCVIAEGWEGDKAYWVHVWMVERGTIVKFREYFDAWLTVRDMRPPLGWGGAGRMSGTLWQSQPSDVDKSSASERMGDGLHRREGNSPGEIKLLNYGMIRTTKKRPLLMAYKIGADQIMIRAEAEGGNVDIDQSCSRHPLLSKFKTLLDQSVLSLARTTSPLENSAKPFVIMI